MDILTKEHSRLLPRNIMQQKSVGAFRNKAVHCINLYYLCQKRYQT